MAVGTRAVITRAASLADGRWILVVEGEARLRIGEWLSEDPYPSALVEEWPTAVGPVDPTLWRRAEQSVRRTRGLLSESGSAPALSADVAFHHDPEVAAWQICAEAPLTTFDAQRLLSCDGATERLVLLIELTDAVEQDLHHLLSSE
jgi:hypothetical protein